MITDCALPKHIGIIMDGNRRWAKKHGKSADYGHTKGYETILKVAKYCRDVGIKNITVYALSTENNKRKAAEIKGIFKLLLRGIEENTDQFLREGFRLKIIGNRENLPKLISRAIDQAEKKTEGCTRGSINVAFNYGGREEIVSAVNRLIKKKIDIDEKSLSEHLYTSDVTDPELIIRSGGQNRLSNFLIWQSAYSELYFTDCLWPDFGPSDMQKALAFYEKTQRNFGK